MQKHIFLTGGTGFLGAYLLKELLIRSDSNVYVLIRAKNQDGAEKRLSEILSRIFNEEMSKKLSCRVKALVGHIELSNFGLNNEYANMLNIINEVYHCAATTKFNISKDEGLRINVNGTRNVVSFVESCKKISLFSYVGTVFIAGNHDGIFREKDFSLKQKFNNYYEETKFEAEKIVRDHATKSFRTLIHRPSVIVGDHSTGYTSNFNMFYEPLRLFSKNLYDVIPADVNTLHNLVPVDVAAKAIVLLSESCKTNDVFHIVSPNDIHCGEFMEIAAKYFSYCNPKFIPIEQFDMGAFSFIKKKMIEFYLPYYNYKAIFDSEYTMSVLKKLDFELPIIDKVYYLKMLKFCKDVNFIKIRRDSVSQGTK